MDATYDGSETFRKLSVEELRNKHPLPPAIPIKKPVKNRVTSLSSANVPRPCKDEVKRYLSQWKTLENYTLQESALDKLFLRTYPKNTDIDEVLIKVSALNDFYSTHIFSPFQVAKHILELQIDGKLQAGDVTLVNDLAKVKINGTTKNFYSFATKYCSHHFPADFPIYDSYVDHVLRYFRDVDSFFHFSNADLKNYSDFKNILLQLRSFYNLEPYNLKDIDKYLWQLGKEVFPKKY